MKSTHQTIQGHLEHCLNFLPEHQRCLCVNWGLFCSKRLCLPSPWRSVCAKTINAGSASAVLKNKNWKDFSKQLTSILHTYFRCFFFVFTILQTDTTSITTQPLVTALSNKKNNLVIGQSLMIQKYLFVKLQGWIIADGIKHTYKSTNQYKSIFIKPWMSKKKKTFEFYV